MRGSLKTSLAMEGAAKPPPAKSVGAPPKASSPEKIQSPVNKSPRVVAPWRRLNEQLKEPGKPYFIIICLLKLAREKYPYFI